MPHSLTFNAIVREEQLGGNNTSIAVAVVWAAQGRQSRRREEGSRGGARKAVVASRGRQSRRHEEGSCGGVRKAAASRGRQSRRREEGSHGGAGKAVAAAQGRQRRRRRCAGNRRGVQIYSKMAYLAMAAGQRAGGVVWLRQKRMVVVVVCCEGSCGVP